MLKRALAAATITGLMLAPTAAHAASAGPVVTGGAQDFTGAHVAISARSGAAGATGIVNATLPASQSPTGGALQFRLKVTCLAVAGSLASIGAVVTDSPANDLFPPGFPFVITIRDSGLPAGRGDGLGLAPGAPADSCAALLSSASAAPDILRGNVVVHA